MGPQRDAAASPRETEPVVVPAPARVRRLMSWLVSKTAVHANRLVGEAFHDIGGRRYHYSLLASLAEAGPASQADLGRRCGFDRSDVALMIGELVDAGYVDRAPDPEDRRRNIITLTDAGHGRLAEMDEVADRVQDELLAPLTDDERAVLKDLLGRVLDRQAREHGHSYTIEKLA